MFSQGLQTLGTARTRPRRSRRSSLTESRSDGGTGDGRAGDVVAATVDAAARLYGGGHAAARHPLGDRRAARDPTGTAGEPGGPPVGHPRPRSGTVRAAPACPDDWAPSGP